MDTQDASNPQQRRHADVPTAGLGRLVRGPSHPGSKEHLLLGEVLPYAGDANAVADGEAFMAEPVVVIGQVGHLSDTRPTMIASQPFIKGLS